MHFDDAAQSAGYDLIGSPIRGGSGVVHRARVRASGDEVALKVLQPGVDVQRLLREADLLERIEHPAIAGFRAVVDLGGQPTLVVDWIDGRPLREVLHDGPMERTAALRHVRTLAAALEAVHTEGVVHGDVSPANVIVRPDGFPVLIDFGVSRSAESATVTVDGAMAGTPRYLAPEVIQGETRTAAGDQYALAVMFQEMVTGEWPFPEGDAIASALHHQLHTAPRPLAEIDGSFPPPWTDAVLRALEKDPSRRFERIGGFVDALEANVGVSTLDKGRRLSVASMVFRVGLPLVLLAALVVPLLTDDEPSDAAAAPEVTATSTTIDPPLTTAEPSPTTLEDRSAAPVTTEAPLETLAPTTTDGAERVAVPSWDAGTAESLACNLLTEADFETEALPDNWFQDGDDPDRPQVQVRTGGGVDDSGALQVGEPNLYGIWGEVVPIVEGNRYLFSANVRIDGEVFTSEMSVDWVDADFGLFDTSPTLDVVAAAPGQVTLITEPAPEGAAWAVPRTFKDNGSGLLYLDEMVFAAEDADCAPLLRG